MLPTYRHLGEGSRQRTNPSRPSLSSRMGEGDHDSCDDVIRRLHVMGSPPVGVGS